MCWNDEYFLDRTVRTMLILIKKVLSFNDYSEDCHQQKRQDNSQIRLQAASRQLGCVWQSGKLVRCPCMT